MRFTKFVPWGNGPNDTKGYSCCEIPGYLGPQQFAPMIKRNQGTARDLMSGRHGPALGVNKGGQWFISYEAAIEYVQAHCLTR